MTDEMTPAAEILDVCPCCHKHDHVETGVDAAGDHIVRCTECSIQTAGAESEEAAKAKWNALGRVAVPLDKNGKALLVGKEFRTEVNGEKRVCVVKSIDPEGVYCNFAEPREGEGGLAYAYGYNSELIEDTWKKLVEDMQTVVETLGEAAPDEESIAAWTERIAKLQATC